MSGKELEKKGSKKETRGSKPGVLKKCSKCGAYDGHNASTCPKLRLKSASGQTSLDSFMGLGAAAGGSGANEPAVASSRGAAHGSEEQAERDEGGGGRQAAEGGAEAVRGPCGARAAEGDGGDRAAGGDGPDSTRRNILYEMMSDSRDVRLSCSCIE